MGDKFPIGEFKGDRKMKKIKVFDDDKRIISTPDLSADGYGYIAMVDVDLNVYGKLVISATSRSTGATGYWAEPLDCVVSQLDNDTLEYLLTSLQREAEQRRDGNADVHM